MPAVYGNPTAVAVINPRLAYGEPGQYAAHKGPVDELMAVAAAARSDGKEVRIYYRDLKASGDEPVASQVIETWIPAGHVQPFHSHETIHEMTIVMEGSIMAVDHGEMTEEQARELLHMGGLEQYGNVVHDHGSVIEGPGTRHTVVNHTDSYAVLMTIQTARIPLAEFPHDWHRDKPAA